MPLDSEEIRMLAQCRILESRLSPADADLITRLEKDPAKNSLTKYLAHVDGEALRDCWERITSKGTDEGEAKRGL